MSLDLYQRETAERLATLKGVQSLPDPWVSPWVLWALGAAACAVLALLLWRFLPRLYRRFRERSIYRRPPS